MTTILPPYTGETARCMKCGHRAARTGYTGAGAACGLMSRLDAVDALERLCRVCERCGYHWDEATVAPAPLEPMTKYVAQIMLDDFRHAMAANGFHVLGMTGGAVYVKAIVPRGNCSPAVGETVPNNQETP